MLVYRFLRPASGRRGAYFVRVPTSSRHSYSSTEGLNRFRDSHSSRLLWSVSLSAEDHSPSPLTSTGEAVVLYLLVFVYYYLFPVKRWNLLTLNVTSSGDQNTSPLGAAASNSEHNPVTREDWDQAGKPSTGRNQVTHRPITRSQSKVRSDTPITADRPSCTASSDTTDEFKADDIWEMSMNANTISSAVSIQADNTTSTLHTGK